MMAQGLRHEQKFLLESRGGRVRGPENPCWTTLSQATFPWAAISCISKDLRILISGLFLDSWGTHHKTRIHGNPSSHSEISKKCEGNHCQRPVLSILLPRGEKTATKGDLHNLRWHTENGSFSWVSIPFPGPFPPYLG